MASTHQSSLDQVSNLKTDSGAFKNPSPASSSSYCTPPPRHRRRCGRQALASLDPNTTPVMSPSSSSCTATVTTTKHHHLQTPRTKSPSTKKWKEKQHNLNISSPVLLISSPPPPLSTKQLLQTPRTKSHSTSKKGMLNQNILSPVPIISPPALEKLHHDLTNRHRPFDESEGEEHYARRRANVIRMRDCREKARKLARRIGKTRKEVEECIQEAGGWTDEMIQKTANY